MDVNDLKFYRFIDLNFGDIARPLRVVKFPGNHFVGKFSGIFPENSLLENLSRQ